ncbi:MAG: hypothetical protein ACYC6R_12235 [Anaerolineales bacterium]
MNVVDSSGWVEYFTNSTNAKSFTAPIQDLENLLVPSIDAAQISLDLKLAMADGIILAATREFDAALWTQDAHFKGLDGVKYIEQKA